MSQVERCNETVVINIDVQCAGVLAHQVLRCLPPETLQFLLLSVVNRTPWKCVN